MSMRERLYLVGAMLLVLVAALLAGRTLLVGQSETPSAPGTAPAGSGGAPSARIRPAFNPEFHTRPDGYRGVTAHYGFSFSSEPKQMDAGLVYKALADGAVDVIDAFATDGRIAAYDLVPLADDKGFFPPYYAAPLVRAEVLAKHPGVGDALSALGGRISNAAMQKLNYAVDEKGEKPEDVARAFLKEQGLLKGEAAVAPAGAGEITIGGKNFTEQNILGELMALLIEHRTGLKVNRKLNLGGTMVCFTALRAGDLDLYAEYTGTGLVNILKEKVIADPDAAYERVKSEFAKQHNLTWLSPLGFNNTYALAMRRAHAEQLGIKSISDLAKHLNASK